MALRGQVFWPPKGMKLPPKQATQHRVVILSNSAISTLGGGQGVHLMVAIIRSAMNQQGRPVRQIPLHSIPLSPGDAPFLQHESIIETHQLFAVHSHDFKCERALGVVPAHVMGQVLAGARKIFA